MPKYRDWLKAEQTNINPAGTPVVVRPSETVGAGYAALTMRNEQIRNTPEAARSGYSALAPVETVSATVPKLASDTPDWAKRTPTEQARVNAAQERAQEQSASTPAVGYAALAPATAPVSVPATGTAPSFANLDDASKARMKQNNPALYNQLLVQGIITPLAEDQKQTATAPATVQKTETVQKTDAGSPSTGETELTGYAKYLADHPEYAEADRRAEAEYARSLPTYGALAERMAQAGIHGGYGEYLDSVAYAQMQSAKEGIAKEAREGYAAYANGVNKDLYTLLTRGSYTDADGNTVQGYTLLDMTDDQYEASKESIKKDLNGLGYSPADIEATFAQVDAVRGTNKADTATRTKTALDSYIKGTTDANKFLEDLGVTDSQIAAATEQYVEQYKQEHGEEISAEEARDAVVWSAIIQTIDDARKNGLLGEGDAGLKVESDFIRKRLPMYGEEYNATGWKDRGETLADSIEDALDYKEAGMMTEQDVKAVINDALGKMFGDKKQEVQYVNTGNSVKMTIVNDKGESEMLKADFDGKATDSAAAWLNHNCANCPIAVYDGQLYYKAYEHGNWMKLRTKGGITPGFNRGTPDQGDEYFKVVAYAMMQNNNYPAFNDEDTTYDIVNGTATTKAKETTKKATQTKGYNALDYNGGAVGVK